MYFVNKHDIWFSLIWETIVIRIQRRNEDRCDMSDGIALSEKLEAWAKDHERSFRELLNEFSVESVEDEGAFPRILKFCPNVDLSLRMLADLADVSPTTIKRWSDGAPASKYDQLGLVADIRAILDKRLEIANLNAA